MKLKQISIGCDHAGFDYKDALVSLIQNLNIKVSDHGTFTDSSVDYPDFVHPTCRDVINGDSQLGIVLCGSGNGVNMTANKYAQIRSALCWNPTIAQLSRQHNNANILAIPVRFIEQELAFEIVKSFITTNFEGGRHSRRVDKIPIPKQF